MQTKHTPGPWNFAKSDIDGRYSIYGNGPLAYCGNTGAADGDGEANARLIAAAPDLLAALEALVGEADLGEVDLDDDDRAKLEQARAAIAKATGGPAVSRPRYLVIWGIRPDCQNVSAYWTDYHAEQYMRALRLNGTPCRLKVLP